MIKINKFKNKNYIKKIRDFLDKRRSFKITEYLLFLKYLKILKKIKIKL